MKFSFNTSIILIKVLLCSFLKSISFSKINSVHYFLSSILYRLEAEYSASLILLLLFFIHGHLKIRIRIVLLIFAKIMNSKMFVISLLILIVRMTVMTLTKFERRAIIISPQIKAYSTNHVIGIYLFMYVCSGQLF